MTIRDRVQNALALVRGGRELALAFVVVVSAPICVTWAREAFTTEKPLAPLPPVALMPVGEPESLHTRYGLSIVAMPDPPSHNAMADVHEAAGAGAPVPVTAAAPLAFDCPEVRAIVTGDDAFAIIAWDDSSYVAKQGQTLATPMGEVKLHRLRPRSLTLTHGDDTLQCSLKR
jgi:hypothetical protein